eukprot:TRINITY_DN412_c0_g1_i1.p1 TRINITY_DN412_c0_g1~~TRINITY_DN412_c0_g1_i1.p1  ORF type:complete len:2369 (-),score=528.98 TRINITY_DN412_c0_g1_i1:269-6628(-)
MNAAGEFSASGEHVNVQGFGNVLFSSVGLFSVSARHDLELSGDRASITGQQGFDVSATGAEANIEISSESGTTITAPVGALQLIGLSPDAHVSVAAGGSFTVEATEVEGSTEKEIIVGSASTSPVAFNAGDLTSFTTSYFLAQSGWEARFYSTTDVDFSGSDASIDGHYVEMRAQDKLDVISGSGAEFYSGDGRDIDLLALNGFTIQGKSVALDSHARVGMIGAQVEGLVFSLSVMPDSGHDIIADGTEGVLLKARGSHSASAYDVIANIQGVTEMSGGTVEIRAGENFLTQIAGDVGITATVLTVNSNELGGEIAFASTGFSSSVLFNSWTGPVFFESDKQFLMESTGGASLSTSNGAGSGILFDAAELAHIGSLESGSYEADNDVNIAGNRNNGEAAFESSNVWFSAASSTATYTFNDMKIDAEGFVHMRSLNDSIAFESTSTTTLKSARDLQFTAQDRAETVVSGSINNDLSVTAVEQLLFSGNGVVFSGSGNTLGVQLTSKGDYNGFIGGELLVRSNISDVEFLSVDESFLFSLEGELSISADQDYIVEGGDILVKSGLEYDIAFQADNDMLISINNRADTIGQIVFEGRELESSSGSDTLWQGGFVDFLSQSVNTSATEDIAYTAVELSRLDAESLFISGQTSATFMALEDMYFKSGEAQDIYGSSSQSIFFNATDTFRGEADNDIEIYVRNNTEVSGGNSVQVTGSASVVMAAEDEVHFVASNGLAVNSGGRLEIKSALGFNTEFYSDDALVGDTRNAIAIEGHGTEGCAVKVTTGEDTVGEFSSSRTIVSILGEEGVEMYARDSLGEFGLLDGAMLFASNRDTTILAEDGAAMFLVDGGFNDNFDGQGFRSMLFRTQDEDGNIEFSADRAEVFVYGEQGVEATTAKFEALGYAGVDVIGYGPTADIQFNGFDVFFDGFRGVNISGGSVSPSSPGPLGIQSFTGDISFQADSEIRVVSKDTVSNELDLALAMRSLSGDISFQATNGHDIYVDAADSVLVRLDRDFIMTAIGGDIELDADVNDLGFSGQGLLISTVDGPVLLSANGIGSDALITGENVAFRAPDIFLSANAGSQWSGTAATFTSEERFGLETDRAVDDILLRADVSVSLVSTGEDDSDGIVISGNNVELETAINGPLTPAVMQWAAQGIVVGSSTSPIMSINAGVASPGFNGVSIIAEDGSVAVDAEYVMRWVVNEDAKFFGTRVGLASDDRIHFVSLQSDVSVLAGSTITTQAKNQHLTATEGINLLAGDPIGTASFTNLGTRDGDELTLLSERDIVVTAEQNIGVASARFDASDDVRTFQAEVLSTDGSILIQNVNHAAALSDVALFDLLDGADDLDPGYVSFVGGYLEVESSFDIVFHNGIHESFDNPDRIEDLESGRFDFITTGVNTPIHIGSISVVPSGPIQLLSEGIIDIESNTFEMTAGGSIYLNAGDDSLRTRAEGDIVLAAQDDLSVEASFELFFQSGALLQMAAGDGVLFQTGAVGNSLSVSALNVSLVTASDTGSDIEVLTQDLFIRGDSEVQMDAGGDFTLTSEQKIDLVGSNFVVSAGREVSFIPTFADSEITIDAVNDMLFYSEGTVSLTTADVFTATSLTGDMLLQGYDGVSITAIANVADNVVSALDDVEFYADGSTTFLANNLVDVTATAGGVDITATGTSTDTGFGLELSADYPGGFVTVQPASGPPIPVSFLAADRVSVYGDDPAAQTAPVAFVASDTIALVTEGEHADMHVGTRSRSDILDIGLTTNVGDMFLSGGNRVLIGPDLPGRPGGIALNAPGGDINVRAEGERGSVRMQAGPGPLSSLVIQTPSVQFSAADILLETVRPFESPLDTTGPRSMQFTSSGIQDLLTLGDMDIYAASGDILFETPGLQSLDFADVELTVGYEFDITASLVSFSAGESHTQLVARDGVVHIESDLALAVTGQYLSVKNTLYGEGYDIDIHTLGSISVLDATPDLAVRNEADVGDIELLTSLGDVTIEALGGTVDVVARGGVQFIAYHPTDVTSSVITADTFNVFSGPVSQVRLQADAAVQLTPDAFTAYNHRLGFFEVTPVAEHYAYGGANVACTSGTPFCGTEPGNSVNIQDGMRALLTALTTIRDAIEMNGLIELPQDAA